MHACMHTYPRTDKARDGAVCNYNEHREADAAKQQQHSAAVDIFYTGERARGASLSDIMVAAAPAKTNF